MDNDLSKLINLYEENGFVFDEKECTLKKQIMDDTLLEIVSIYADFSGIIDIWVNNKEYKKKHVVDRINRGTNCMFFKFEKNFLIDHIREIQEYVIDVVKNMRMLDSKPMYFKRKINKTYIFCNEEAFVSFMTTRNNEKKYKLKFHKVIRKYGSEFDKIIRP